MTSVMKPIIISIPQNKLHITPRNPETDLKTKRQRQNATVQNPNTKKCLPRPQNPNPQTPNTQISGISYIGVLSVAFRPDTPEPIAYLEFDDCKIVSKLFRP